MRDRESERERKRVRGKEQEREGESGLSGQRVLCLVSLSACGVKGVCVCMFSTSPGETGSVENRNRWLHQPPPCSALHSLSHTQTHTLIHTHTHCQYSLTYPFYLHYL